jgi:hypothetical protein
MNYPDGEKIKVGDTLKLWDGCLGVVVCSIEDGEFSDNFSEDDWAYLKEGILIKTDSAGLVHYTEPEETFLLISRATS